MSSKSQKQVVLLRRESMRSKPFIILLTVFSIFLNIVGRGIAMTSVYQLPLWLDSFGTALAACCIGPVSGALVGLTANLLIGMSRPISLIYGINAIMIGLIIGVGVRHRQFETLFRSLRLGFLLVLLNVLLSGTLDLLLYDGSMANPWGDGVIRFLQQLEIPKPLCVYAGEYALNFLDKLLMCFILYFAVNRIDWVRPWETISDTSEDGTETKETVQSFTGEAMNQVIKELKLVPILFMTGLFTAGAFECDAAEKLVSQNYSVFTQTVFCMDDMLPCSEVNALAQTPDSVLWAGSYSGLFRYNGSRFVHMSSFDSVRNVNCLLVDEEGRLWIGTNDTGLAICINKEITNNLDKKDGLPSNSIRSIIQSSDGLYYVGTSSALQLMHMEGGLSLLWTIPEVTFATDMSADQESRVAAVSSSGELFLMKEGKLIDRCPEIENGITFRCCAFSEEGYLYVGLNDGRIGLFSVAGDKLKFMSYKAASRIGQINRLVFQEDGTLFMLGENGIAYYDSLMMRHMINSDGFSSSIVNMTMDYQGNLWFASDRFGLMRLCRSPFTDLFQQAGVEKRIVNTITRWKGKTYIGSDDGLVILDGSKANVIASNLTKYLEKTRIRCIRADDEDCLWISTYGKGLVRMLPNGSIYRFNQESGFPGTRSRMSLELQNGTVAATGDKGIAFIRDSKVIKSLIYDEGLAEAEALCLYELPDGTLMMGTDGDGIILIKDGKKAGRIGTDEGLLSEVIMRIVEDKKGDGVFIVTSNSISYRYADGRIRELKLPYYNNYDLSMQGSDVYILSSVGIITLKYEDLMAENDSETPLSYELLDRGYGLRGSLTANAWNYTDDRGDIYLSSDEGAFILNTQNFRMGNRSLRSSIAEAYVDDKSVPVSHDQPIVITRGAKRLKLIPEIMNYSFDNPYISYYLEGFDEAPVIVHQRSLEAINYTNLPIGTYRFHLGILNDEKDRVIEEVSYLIRKEPEMYEHIWFKGYMMTIVLLTGIWLTWFIMQSSMERTLQRQRFELKETKKRLAMGEEAILTIARAVDARDENTAMHSKRVSEYAVAIGRAIGMDEQECMDLRRTGLMHDIGKIAIPDSILKKPGRLTDEEYKVMQSHVVEGAAILADFTLLDHVVEGALYHHERYDGRGYAKGLKGEEIPLYGRIIGIADAFDAMTANRVYRKQLEMDFVLNELRRCRGTQFDPKLTDVFLGLIEDGTIDVESLYAKTMQEVKEISKINLQKVEKLHENKD